MGTSNQDSPETPPSQTTPGDLNAGAAGGGTTSGGFVGDSEGTSGTGTALVGATPGETRLALQLRDPSDKKRVFLDALAADGTVRVAAQAAHVDRRAVYIWRDEDPEFRQGWIDAIDDVADSIESPFIERARKGEFLHGIAMLKALRPAKFRDNYNPSVHITKNEYHISFKIADAGELPTEVPSEDVTDDG